jgi:hypothetical protein
MRVIRGVPATSGLTVPESFQLGGFWAFWAGLADRMSCKLLTGGGFGGNESHPLRQLQLETPRSILATVR